MIGESPLFVTLNEGNATVYDIRLAFFFLKQNIIFFLFCIDHKAPFKRYQFALVH